MAVVFGWFAASIVLLSLLSGRVVAQQAHGIAPSVTSQNFGSHHNQPTGIAPSVSSVGGYGTHRGNGGHGGGYVRGRNSHYIVGWPYYYDYPYIPYVDDLGPNDAVSDDYSGGPTIFDRRGSASASAASDRPVADRRSQSISDDDSGSPIPDSAPAAPQPATVLVFKDGHTAEVKNYAIVGQTLYDLGDGKRHKIDLAELDLSATAKQNDDRGIDFELPASAQSN